VERAPLLFPAPRRQWRAPESVLGLLCGGRDAAGEVHPLFAGRQAFNGPVYAMLRLRVEPRLCLDCREGWYFDSLNTAERLEMEGRYWRCSIPARRSLDGSGRTAAIGISTVVAWPEGRGWKTLAAPLGAKAMPHRAGLLHVVPSGMFAPPYSVVENVRRELREELGLELAARQLRLTGVAVHALNQRPEICTLLLLRRRPAVKLNEEFAPRVAEVPLRPGLAPGDLRGFFAPGAAAMALAARMLAEAPAQEL
jgi:ADP-ribose pyrophosphatase YjhB (NUDIX family)